MPHMDFCGHAWERRLFVLENGTYREFVRPGGAALAARLAGYAMDGSANAPCKREYVSLRRVSKAGKGAGTAYAAGGSGWVEGSCLVPPTSGDAAVIWDEGFGGIALPEHGPVLWASNRALPGREIAAAIMGRGILMLDADVLRCNGAMISRQVSWEHTATDLVWQLDNNPAIRHLSMVRHIVILFAEDGAMYVRGNGKDRKATLVLASGNAEGSLRAANFGSIPEAWACMVAQCASQLLDVLQGRKALSLTALLRAGGPAISRGYEASALEAEELPALPADSGEEDPDQGYPVPLYDSSQGADPHYWCIGSEAGGRRVFDVALDYVKNGATAIKGLPHISFGGLTTVDRREIEAFSNIRNIIMEYAASSAGRPLSLVVFGAPGSGKSFGVTQIAKSVLPGVVEKLEFNVSQFAGSADLANALHRVRDITIEGKLPLVFFDEFDSDREGRPLGWLKSFLMPMQDGKFIDDAGEHPIGRCIFVFAGGTSPTFEDFILPMQSKQQGEGRQFREVKGPDFVSRLRGTVNVLGPNPAFEGDRNYILRRALLLRSLCERKLPMRGTEAPIHDNIVKAMLLVPRYKHGARSMEALLDMSRIEGATWEPASLPFYTQLSLHVDADAFIRLVLNETRLESFTEKLAQAIHGQYVSKQQEAQDGAYTQPWEELDEEIRESNRRQARSIERKLCAIGCSYDAGDTPFLCVQVFEPEEVLLLARLEHDLWMAEKTANGWVYGPARDNKNKVHPDMVPWEDLTPAAQQKDIDTVGYIIPLLQSVGLRVYRTV